MDNDGLKVEIDRLRRDLQEVAAATAYHIARHEAANSALMGVLSVCCGIEQLLRSHLRRQ